MCVCVKVEKEEDGTEHSVGHSEDSEERPPTGTLTDAGGTLDGGIVAER